MYQITFPATSNRATWIFTGQISDANTNEPLDLTGLSFVFEVREPGGCQKLLATTDNGKFAVIDTGIFRWEFSKEEMRSLCAGSYDTGMTMANADQTTQLSVGPLPIIDGNTP
jgi:hypothetical protein